MEASRDLVARLTAEAIAGPHGYDECADLTACTVHGWPLASPLHLTDDAGADAQTALLADLHTTDADCLPHLVDGSCTVCHADHTDPCPSCRGTGYHTAACLDGYPTDPAPAPARPCHECGSTRTYTGYDGFTRCTWCGAIPETIGADGNVYGQREPAPAPVTTCIEHAYGTTTRLTFQVRIF
ncbi:MAG: hypothetical protein ABIW84_00125 [Ilumatobacteraceae bacterium]